MVVGVAEADGGEIGVKRGACVGFGGDDTDFVGIDLIAVAVSGGSQVGHEDIGPGLEAHVASMRGVEGGERGGGWDVGGREKKSGEGVAPTGEIGGDGHLAGRGFLPERRLWMGQVWAQAHHVHGKVSEGQEILHDGFQGLPGEAKHHARADFVALRLHAAELVEAGMGAGEGRAFRNTG